MSYKAEIGWTRRDEEGVRVQVYVHHVGGEWRFYRRARRFEPWAAVKDPPLEDWVELLGAVRRRIARRRLRPEAEGRVRKSIRERFPESQV